MERPKGPSVLSLLRGETGVYARKMGRRDSSRAVGRKGEWLKFVKLGSFSLRWFTSGQAACWWATMPRLVQGCPRMQNLAPSTIWPFLFVLKLLQGHAVPFPLFIPAAALGKTQNDPGICTSERREVINSGFAGSVCSLPSAWLCSPIFFIFKFVLSYYVFVILVAWLLALQYCFLGSVHVASAALAFG